MRWNATLPDGDTPPLDAERKAKDLAEKHNVTVQVMFDEAAGVTSVTVEGSQGGVRRLLEELGATDVVQEP